MVFVFSLVTRITGTAVSPINESETHCLLVWVQLILTPITGSHCAPYSAHVQAIFTLQMFYICTKGIFKSTFFAHIRWGHNLTKVISMFSGPRGRVSTRKAIFVLSAFQPMSSKDDQTAEESFCCWYRSKVDLKSTWPRKRMCYKLSFIFYTGWCTLKSDILADQYFRLW